MIWDELWKECRQHGQIGHCQFQGQWLWSSIYNADDYEGDDDDETGDWLECGDVV